ncbi:aldose 1-epimerase [Malassezia pachydermatis]|uniref:Galactose mutarotase-like protein n=1 Tax=Malassezia pachydermatis TaxID=77020 RepID=A0A0M8MXK8_9BASI|nr:galactose mutarotase-like protein [Malassezia pachydermatis]KOS16364.1 galactose mutarotase-like protein [Malassezia pachydermatis]
MQLVSKEGKITVTVLPYGLTIHSIEVKTKDVVHELLAGPEDAADHTTYPRQFYGPIVGRYANRLPAGPRQVHDAHVAWREWGGDGVSHHGGPPPPLSTGTTDGLVQAGPWDCVEWTPLETQAVCMYTPDECQAWDDRCVWALESPDGDQGYPGRVRVEALIGVRSQPGTLGQVHVEYRAQLLPPFSTSTPINLTQHWGFQLAASDPRYHGATIDEHLLQLGVEGQPLYHLALDERGIATGEVDACEGMHDWTSMRPIQAHDYDYDDFYVWGQHDTTKPVAHVQGPTGVELVVRTNQAGVQLYTANSKPAPFAKKQKHRRHHAAPETEEKHGAAFLEFSAPHATCLYPSLAKLAGTTTMLASHQVYQHWVTIDVIAP